MKCRPGKAVLGKRMPVTKLIFLCAVPEKRDHRKKTQLPRVGGQKNHLWQRSSRVGMDLGRGNTTNTPRWMKSSRVLLYKAEKKLTWNLQRLLSRNYLGEGPRNPTEQKLSGRFLVAMREKKKRVRGVSTHEKNLGGRARRKGLLSRRNLQ